MAGWDGWAADLGSGLATDVAALEQAPGSSVLVHSSLRNIDPDPPGPATLYAALREVLGPRATIVVPAFTARNSTTTRAFRRRTAGMTAEQRAAAEASISGFDRSWTPAQDVGVFAEYVRCLPGAVRSNHPQASFCAVGPDAAAVTDGHALADPLGEHSPLARLYAADAAVFLLGVGFDVCTCFHLAEHRLPWPAPRQRYRTFVLVNGERIQRDFSAAVAEDRDFARLGSAMTQALGTVVRRARVGRAYAYAFPIRAAVDYAVRWMTRERPPAPCVDRRPV